MTKQTIVHVINSLGRGGAETLLVNTLALLPEYDHVVVVLYRQDDFELQARHLAREVVCLEVRSTADLWKKRGMLRDIIRRTAPVCVHAHLQMAGLIAKLACPRQVPFFYTLHNPYSRDAFGLNRLAVYAERLTARPRHHLIGVSQLVIDDYLQFVPRSGSTDVLYNFVDHRFFELPGAAAYQPGTPLRCVCVANLKEQKNHFYTLRNFVRLKHLPITLDLYGEGYQEASLREFIEQNGLKNVHLRGKVADVASLLPEYHLYVLSSTYEGFGIAPLEALAAAVPAVVSDIPVFREVIGDAAMYTDISKPDDLSGILEDIYHGRRTTEAYGARGRAQARCIASEERYIAALRSIYAKYVPAMTQDPQTV